MSNSNFLWLFKTSLFNTSRFFSSFNSHTSVSGKPNRCGVTYHQLSGEEDNNNQTDKSCSSIKSSSNSNNNKRCSLPNRQSLDDPDEHDSLSDSDDEDEEDRLTCWVCERSFSSTRILQRHKIHERHFGCGTCEAIFPTLMALETHQEEADHWSDGDDDDDVDESIEDLSDDSALDTDDEIEIDRKGNDHLKKERLFLL